MKLKEKIVKYSKEIGIDLIGFAHPDSLKDLACILEDRRNKNYLSGFEEKEINRRINPRYIMRDVESIIVVGVSYYVDDKKIKFQDNSGFYGKISRVSWGKDYHLVLMRQMEQLVNYIKEEVGRFSYRLYVDTGPLVERHLAYKSGIGWYGKNNCIINKNYGSWIFIGHILCNLPIEFDRESETECYNCNKCIKACPTGALMDNHQYNSKKCISYLTQTKGDIDYDLRERMGNNLYGCDICQLACPHNRNTSETDHKEFFPEQHNYKPDLLEILCMSNKEFKEKYGKSALGWRGNTVLKRNALIAIGNSHNPEAINYITEYLRHDSPMIRKYAAWAIIRLDKDKGKKILNKHLKTEKDDEVISEIKKLYSYYLAY